MHRFFVPPACIDSQSVTLDGDVAHQLASVLRARAGERVVVLDGSGWEYLVALERITPRYVRGRVVERVVSIGEPRVRITLYQAVLKAGRFETVLQKGTELGVFEFVPVFCARSVPKERGSEWGARRYERWRRIISEAAEQAHRGRIPALRPPVDFHGACEKIEGLALIPWEQESGTGLKAALERWKQGGPSVSAVSVFTGPEGGFTSEEIEYARARGIVPVSLGKRILRAETAAIAVISAVLYELGELGG